MRLRLLRRSPLRLSAARRQSGIGRPFGRNVAGDQAERMRKRNRLQEKHMGTPPDRVVSLRQLVICFMEIFHESVAILTIEARRASNGLHLQWDRPKVFDC